MARKLKYHNITISGKVGVGGTTLFDNLKTHLGPLGWKFFTAGEFMRKYAQEKGLFPKDAKEHHLATAYSDEFDKKVDYGMRERMQKKDNQVFEGWLAGFMAREVKGVLKVLLICSDMSVVIDRIVNRDSIAIEEAKAHIKEREEKNIQKWKRIYGEHDFYDPKQYDLVIDTYANSKEETLEKVLKELGFYD
ncbi:cytidylate kinase family protein [Candidatus Microgenomates bacterium]|nr:cytidylate kinase family protein [Candidatus Microgenomates bacterium]